jgi:DNA-binding winged helix-turn-helix (wHTH) protein
MSAATVPLIRRGVDRLPTTCSVCEGGLVASEPPRASSAYGTIRCVGCRAVVAYTMPPPIGPGARPGCDDRCRRGFHNPEAHETYGRLQGAAERRALRSGCVVCGPLVVDYDQAAVFADGVRVPLTGIEWGLMSRLAASVGRVVPKRDLVFDVWGYGASVDAEAWGLAEYRALVGQDAHLLRTNMARLRPKLGAAKDLLRTVPFVGYVLDASPMED